MTRSFRVAMLALLLPGAAFAQPAPLSAAQRTILAALDAQATRYAAIAREIWQFAEVGYQETRSSALLASTLEAAGFRMTRGVAGEPTAFTAEFGSGSPVLAIIGEFDALPGLSQDSVPMQRAITVGGAGHGCGHNLFGTASVAAAIAVKEWMVANKVTGTLRFYGTPAEEGGSGKVYMVRDGLFRDVDAVVSWHPADRNQVSASTTLANITGKFRFRGVSSHAAAAPERGRSALDGVEAMDMMVNMLREHVPSDTRIHYVITNGGRAPNVVPDFAEVYYYARHSNMAVLQDVWDRIVAASKGAAMGTGTTVELEVTGAVYNVLANETLARVQQRNLERVGGVTYTAAERAFAEQLQRSLMPGTALPLEEAAKVHPLREGGSGGASTDMGDVSWVVPTVQLSAATWVPGVAAHSWQAVSTGGGSIGAKGMMVAAKTIALTTAELFGDRATLQAARAELERRRGAGWRYATALGTRAPALDYRK
ncbi:MAG: amidohydrolase [Gemmatimonadaceae bacterium]|jgi:aminobenzoyl-glutamate utilization protein B|nr:amidohydrolase [Gemmatimonadaceae bacterium]